MSQASSRVLVRCRIRCMRVIETRYRELWPSCADRRKEVKSPPSVQMTPRSAACEAAPASLSLRAADAVGARCCFVQVHCYVINTASAGKLCAEFYQLEKLKLLQDGTRSMSSRSSKFPNFYTVLYITSKLLQWTGSTTDSDFDHVLKLADELRKLLNELVFGLKRE